MKTSTHTRGSHSDDFDDREPCYCDQKMTVNVEEYQKMWSKELLHRYTEIYAMRKLKNYLLDFKDIDEMDLELSLMLSELHKRLPVGQHGPYFFLHDCPDCKVIACGKHI